MTGISALAVKALREKTGLPMMDCKQALKASEGDEGAAIEWLRKRGGQIQSKRSDRKTEFGRIGIYASLEANVGAMVELMCESATVTNNEEFIQLANELAERLAKGPGASSEDELLDQPSQSDASVTLRAKKDELFNRIREVFKIGRMVRIGGPCGAYSHNAATVSGVLVEVRGGTPEPVKDVCMHVAAMRPTALRTEDLDPQVVAKEREILRDAARKEGKPDTIIDKMVEGRLRSFYAQTVLTEQPFVKDEKLTVGKYASQNGFEILSFVRWELGKD